MMNDVWEDLRFFAEHLRGLRVSESVALGAGGGFCVSTNNEFENWVYFPERVTDTDTVNMAAGFFRERGETFMWPVYDGGGEVLADGGLVRAGHLEAMSFDPSHAVTNRGNNAVTLRKIGREASGAWASCMWSAFAYGDGGPSREYCALVEALCDDGAMSLYVAELAGHDAGGFLLTDEPGLAGVYYFGVKPDFRRRGVASAMMSGICGLSGGKKIVLQATPSGVPFYEAFGFADLGAIEVYSTVADIF
ncbi:MAG: GNAT family N-acetyltransferase [Synergistaceae bacterium]|nr:GNAT family N-acetyltransferase [Synergistaceae bacterium]